MKIDRDKIILDENDLEHIRNRVKEYQMSDIDIIEDSLNTYLLEQIIARELAIEGFKQNLLGGNEYYLIEYRDLHTVDITIGNITVDDNSKIVYGVLYR